jgi:glycosyltransferase involved in cell wall biosynthesis
MLPTISVIIPTYNRKQLVLEAINSVLQQEPYNYEVLVIDDGSTDGTSPYLASLGLNIRIIRSEVNTGSARARNLGIKAARGAYIAFLDSDDLWLPQKLHMQLAYFCSHPDVALVYTNEYYQVSGQILETRFDRIPPQSTFLYPAFVDTCPIQTSSVMVKASVFAELGYFNEELHVHDDSDMWNRISESYAFGFIEQPLVTYQWEIDQEHIMHDKYMRRFIEEARKYLRFYEERRRHRTLSYQEAKAISDSYAVINALESHLNEIEGLSNVATS